jgi:hypothetical protein
MSVAWVQGVRLQCCDGRQLHADCLQMKTYFVGAVRCASYKKIIWSDAVWTLNKCVQLAIIEL